MPPKARGASVWGQWVRKVRNDHAHLNQTDFGLKIARSKGTITDWERGANDPDKDSVVAIVKAFPDCPPPPWPAGAEGLTGRSGTVPPDSPRGGGYVVQTYQGQMLAEIIDQLPAKLRTEAARRAMNAIAEYRENPTRPAAEPGPARGRHS